MIHAYNNQYLDDAMKCLGEAMDYVVNSCKLDMDTFLDTFLAFLPKPCYTSYR